MSLRAEMLFVMCARNQTTLPLFSSGAHVCTKTPLKQSQLPHRSFWTQNISDDCAVLVQEVESMAELLQLVRHDSQALLVLPQSLAAHLPASRRSTEISGPSRHRTKNGTSESAAFVE